MKVTYVFPYPGSELKFIHLLNLECRGQKIKVQLQLDSLFGYHADIVKVRDADFGFKGWRKDKVVL